MPEIGCEIMRNGEPPDADDLRGVFNRYFHIKRQLGLGDATILPSVGS